MAKIAELEARQALNALEKWGSALLAARQADVGLVPASLIYSDAASKTGALFAEALHRFADVREKELITAGYPNSYLWKLEVLQELFGQVAGHVPELEVE